MSARQSLLLLLLVGGCKSATPPSGFGVDLTVRADGVADRKTITQANITVSGAEQFTKTVDGSSLRSGQLHARYVPGVTSGSLAFHVEAVAADDSVVATGDSGEVTLTAGHSASAEVSLGAPSTGELGVPADLAAADLANAGTDGSMDLSKLDACVFSGPEDCFDGIDNDCNGMTDCEDPTCAPVAMCTPGQAGAALGVQVAKGDTCPSGFPDVTVLNQGLSGGLGCIGCTCDKAACKIDLYHYNSAASCPSAAAAKTLMATVSTLPSCTLLNFPCDTAGGTASYNASPGYSATSCTPHGTATPDATSWATTIQFCGAHRKGIGCGPGHACIPKTLSTITALSAGTQTCTGAYAPVMGGTWYTDLSDTRTCGTCTCGSVTGANCTVSDVSVWSTMTCDTGGSALGSGDNCNVPNSFCGTFYHSASVNPYGATLGTCTPNSVVSSSLTPTGEQTFCTQ